MIITNNGTRSTSTSAESTAVYDMSNTLDVQPDGDTGSIPGTGPNGAKTFSRTPTSWDAEDDVLLMHLKDQQKLGWKEIASHFNNRTPNACQFRWRRLKSGNLKNPPKSAAALGTLIPKSNSNDQDSVGNPLKQKPKKLPMKKETTGFAGTYSPISNVLFTGYDNSISNALAGLNALSNSSSLLASPVSSFQGNTTIKTTNDMSQPSTPNLNSPSLVLATTQDANHSDDNVPLDPQHHQNAAANSGGGYYVDISIDPTSNLPHNLPHPQTPSSITPRDSTYGPNAGPGQLPNFHNNSIIQIRFDERTSVSSNRGDSVSSLPSKSMNIPHHQLNSNALAHLPILFGNNSVSGPSRNSSISGATGIQHSTTVTSLRNGSIAGPSLGYYSRSGSVVIPYNADKKDSDVVAETTPEKKPETTITKNKIKSNSYNFQHRKYKEDKEKEKDKPSMPVFKLPWTMEEDELLINRRNRELSFAELSILLPQRTEGEIWSRIDYLEKLKNGHRALNIDRRRRLSSIGLDDVDDFYDDVIGGIDVSDDDDDVDVEDEEHDVLVDVEDRISDHRRRRKRRTSSAVNPLAVSDSIRRRLR